MRPCGAVLAIARAENPVAFAGLILDAKVVAHGSEFRIALPPFAKNTLRAIGAGYASAYAPPGERRRRVIRQQRHGLDRLWYGQKPRGPGPMLRPGPARCLRQRRYPADGAFGHVACHRRDPIEPARADTVGESMPKPGSIVSILSQSNRVRRFVFRAGRAVPTRTACARLSTR